MKKKKLTIKNIANSMQCPCSVCSSQDIKIEDNFNQVGKGNFTKLVLSALEASKLKHNTVLTSIKV